MKFAIFLLVLIPIDFSAKQVALTFDDGPCLNGETLLDALDAAGVKATFFLIGQNVAGRQAQIQRAVSAGHEIGCHGYGYNANPPASEITQGQQAIAAAGGGTCNLFRAPEVNYGSVVDACKELGLPLIGTDCWSHDYNPITTEQVIDNILNSAHDGAIPLMHWPNTAPMTADAVVPIVGNLTEQGYEFLTVSELAAAKGVTLRAGVRYDSILQCDGLSSGSCGAQFHCAWAGGKCLDTCKGLSCESCEYQETCAADTECTWNGTDCEEKPSCAGLSCDKCVTQKKCEEKTECVWKEAACADIPVEDDDSSKLSTAPRLFVVLAACIVSVFLLFA